MTTKGSVRTRVVASRLALAVLMSAALSGCASRDLTLPDAEQVESHYEYPAGLKAEIVGNVAVVTVAQSASQLRSGGKLWAKVGPYIFLFSDETRLLFDDFPGLAAVRVVTRVGDSEVANAILTRDELGDLTWRRALNIAGKARRDGTGRMTLLEDLVDWGEDHTEFTYNPRYTQR